MIFLDNTLISLIINDLNYSIFTVFLINNDLRNREWAQKYVINDNILYFWLYYQLMRKITKNTKYEINKYFLLSNKLRETLF